MYLPKCSSGTHHNLRHSNGVISRCLCLLVLYCVMSSDVLLVCDMCCMMRTVTSSYTWWHACMCTMVHDMLFYLIELIINMHKYIQYNKLYILKYIIKYTYTYDIHVYIMHEFMDQCMFHVDGSQLRMSTTAWVRPEPSWMWKNSLVLPWRKPLHMGNEASKMVD